MVTPKVAARRKRSRGQYQLWPEPAKVIGYCSTCSVKAPQGIAVHNATVTHRARVNAQNSIRYMAPVQSAGAAAMAAIYHGMRNPDDQYTDHPNSAAWDAGE